MHTNISNLNIKNTKRWEDFQTLSALIVAEVAQEFPKPIHLDRDAIFTQKLEMQRVTKEEEDLCKSYISERRRQRVKLSLAVLEEIEHAVLAQLRKQITNGRDDTFAKAVRVDLDRISTDPSVLQHFNLSRKLMVHEESPEDVIILSSHRPEDTLIPSSHQFDPWAYLHIENLRKIKSDGLSTIITEQVSSIISKHYSTCSDINIDNLCGALSHVIENGYLGKQLLSARDAIANSLMDEEEITVNLEDMPDDQSTAISAFLTTATNTTYKKECAKPECGNWSEIETIRERHRDWESKSETWAGTVEYLLDSGILLRKTSPGKRNGKAIERYTLSPGMIAPLMTQTSKMGDSGFSFLSRMGNASGESLKELAKEAASIVFSSSVIGVGKLIMGQ